jgi:hypothetical protein
MVKRRGRHRASGHAQKGFSLKHKESLRALGLPAVALLTVMGTGMSGLWLALVTAGAVVWIAAEVARRTLRRLSDATALKLLPWVAAIEVGVASLIVFVAPFIYPELASRLGVAPSTLVWMRFTPMMGFGPCLLAQILVAPRHDTADASRRVRRARGALLAVLSVSLTAMALAPSVPVLLAASVLTGMAGSVVVLLKAEAFAVAAALGGEKQKSRTAAVVSSLFMWVVIAASVVIALTGSSGGNSGVRLAGLPAANWLLLTMAALTLAGRQILPSLTVDRGTLHWPPVRKGMWTRPTVRAMASTVLNGAGAAPYEQATVGLFALQAVSHLHPVMWGALAELTMIPAAVLVHWWMDRYEAHKRRWELRGVALLPLALLIGGTGSVLHLGTYGWVAAFLACFCLGELSTGATWAMGSRVVGQDVFMTAMLEGVRFTAKALAGAITLALPGDELDRVWIPGLILAVLSLAPALWKARPAAKTAPARPSTDPLAAGSAQPSIHPLAAGSAQPSIHPLAADFVERWHSSPVRVGVQMRHVAECSAGITSPDRPPWVKIKRRGHYVLGLQHWEWMDDHSGETLEVWTRSAQVVGVGWHGDAGRPTVSTARIRVVADTLYQRVSVKQGDELFEVLLSKAVGRRRGVVTAYRACTKRRCRARGMFVLRRDHTGHLVGLTVERRWQRDHLHKETVRYSRTGDDAAAETVTRLATQLAA